MLIHDKFCRITADEFSKIWRGGQERTVEPPAPRSFSFGKFVKKEVIRRPDGTLEQKQIISDSEGNKETIVTREVGNQKYVVTTKTDKYGVETKSENLINMDESKYIDNSEYNIIYKYNHIVSHTYILILKLQMN